jgi:hypothetical protein
MEQIIYIVTESTKNMPLKPKIFYNYKDVRTEIFNHFNYECHLNHFNYEEQVYETVHIADALNEIQEDMQKFNDFNDSSITFCKKCNREFRISKRKIEIVLR